MKILEMRVHTPPAAVPSSPFAWHLSKKVILYPDCSPTCEQMSTKEQPGLDILHASSFTPPASVLQLLHPVEGGSRLEPRDLRLVKGVVEVQSLLAAVTVLQYCLKRLSRAGQRHCHSTQHSRTASLTTVEGRCPLTFPGENVLSPLMEILSSGRILS